MKSFQKIRISNYLTKLVDFQSFVKCEIFLTNFDLHLKVLFAFWHKKLTSYLLLQTRKLENPKPRNPNPMKG